jgi:hypothetical protein
MQHGSSGENDDHAESVSRDVPCLESIFEALAASRQVRTELVDDLRSQMDDGAYMSREKLDLAIYRMLKDVLR